MCPVPLYPLVQPPAFGASSCLVFGLVEITVYENLRSYLEIFLEPKWNNFNELLPQNPNKISLLWIILMLVNIISSKSETWTKGIAALTHIAKCTAQAKAFVDFDKHTTPKIQTQKSCIDLAGRNTIADSVKSCCGPKYCSDSHGGIGRIAIM